MTLATILEIIKGVLQFPEAILKLIRILRDTPVEQHAKIMEKIEAERKHLEETGRPIWD